MKHQQNFIIIVIVIKTMGGSFWERKGGEGEDEKTLPFNKCSSIFRNMLANGWGTEHELHKILADI
jgi:hypothetical protein